MNIFDPIFFQARLAPHRPAVGFPGGFVTYGQLATGASAVAQAASTVGLRSGDLVALRIVNPMYQILTIIALGRLGIATLSAPSLNAETYAGLKVNGYIGDKPTDIFGKVKTIVADDKWFLSKLHAKVAVPFSGIDMGQDEVCRISLSSGTTGRPKAIALTAKCMETRLSRVTINPSGLRTLSMLGLTTAWGFLIMTRTLRNGGMYCFAPIPEDVIDLCMFAQIRDIWASTDQLASLVRTQGERERALPALESVTVGGSSISRLLVTEARQRLCKNVILTYGSTETGPVASSPSAYVPEMAGAVGYLFPWMKLEIVDDNDRNLGFDREGTVRIAGDDSVGSYLVADAESEGIFKDGWFYPGDLGVLHKDGLLTIVGRTSEVINRGGVKIAPAILEDVIKTHPSIADAGVVAITDAKGVPQIWAGVVTKGKFSESEVMAYARGKLGDVSPNRIIAVGRVPRNQLGKIIRAELAQQLQRSST